MAIKIIEKTKCIGCHSCVNICPKKCISMSKDMEGFLYPIVRIDECINCNLCTKVCPIINYPQLNNNDSQAFAAINKNEKQRFASSSGGLFSVIAEDIIDRGGVVFGAAFDESFNVFHICVSTKEELAKLRGSKYVQSIIGNSYSQAKKYLDNGILVLFSGTPCQIAGLYSYLGKIYNNLITQDIVCHGVPSPMVWQKYVEYRNHLAKSSVKSVFFRNKETGWKSYSLKFVFQNGLDYSATIDNGNSDDPYMNSFLKNFSLRPSCYDCSFKTFKRPADITLGDFWGIQLTIPEMDDNKGTSLLIIHSLKGKALIDNISDKISIKKVDFDSSNNDSIILSSTKPMERDFFFKKLSVYNFETSYSKLQKKIKFDNFKMKWSLGHIMILIKKTAKKALNILKRKKV